VTDLAPLLPLAAEIITTARQHGLKIATAESCTGGLVAAVLTEIAGSSAVVDRGFVTYSNTAKSDLLDVPAGLIAERGAVSEEVARAMAEGALARSAADIVVAVTGIAGPGGGTPDKPVGLVHFAGAKRGGPMRHVIRLFRDSGRSSIRLAAVREALAILSALMSLEQGGRAPG
jgi:nicotinamide-nucleotide amidase